MTQARTHLPGHLPIAPGRAVALEPRSCGTMQVGAGAVVVADRLLGPGDKLQLWRGDSVQVVNIAHQTTAFFSWEACAQPPTARDTIRHAWERVTRFFSGDRHPKLAECGEAKWCVGA